MSPESFLIPLTDLGNLYVALPVAAALGLWLHRTSGWAVTVKLWLLLGAMILVVGALKYVAWSRWIQIPGADAAHYRGAPSGHAALAGFVYGATALFLIRARAKPMRLAAPLAFALLALAVAFSRIALGAHPIGEVLAGLAAAILFLLPNLPSALSRAPGHEAILITATLGIALAAELSGARFRAEQDFFAQLQSFL